jgi:hypothetical protein
MATVHAIRELGVLDLPLGMDLLDTPSRNTGTAFRQSERTKVGLYGLLPPPVESLRQRVTSTQWTPAYPTFVLAGT